MIFKKRPLFIFLCFTFIVVQNASSQYLKNDVYIEWNSPLLRVLPDSSLKWSLHFEGGVYHDGHIPFWKKAFENKRIVNVSILNPRYAALDEEEEALIDKNDLIEEILSFKTLYQRNKPISFVEIFPFKYDSLFQKIVKLVSFTLSFETSGSLRSKSLHKTKAPSVLANGKWIKLGISEPGIYKIDEEFLKKAGFNTASIDPRNIKIYGNGGKMLPQKNNAPRHTDIIENAIFVSGESDGRFDNNDYLLFYGQSPDSYEYDPELQKFVYQKHIYSDTSYYFLTVSGGNGLRVETQANLGNGFPSITTFDDHYIYEKDELNFLSLRFRNLFFGGSGREWYGDQFNPGMARSYKVELRDIVSGSPLKFTSSAMASSLGVSEFDLRINNQSIGKQTFSSVESETYRQKGLDNIREYTLSYNGGTNAEISYSYNASSFSTLESRSFLNYFIIDYLRSLRFSGMTMKFHSIQSLGQSHSTFEIDNMDGQAIVWDITNPLNPKRQLFTLNGSKAYFGSESNILKDFVVFSPQNVGAPMLFGEVTNQNLRGLAVPDLVIVTYPEFMTQANRLAEFRRSHDQMDVVVCTPREIYNEFSSGSQDVTAIRDFMKYLYDSDPDKLKYLLLFGKCSYDFKDRLANNTNFVPTYQSRNSLHPIYSYASDDYYGFLDDDEGEWIESISGDHLLDIGIGRLPVVNRNEATEVVNKIIHYASHPNRFGNWKNVVTFVAEDGDFNIHQRDADNLAKFIETNYPQYNVKKIFIDAYPQIMNSVGEYSAPEVREDINHSVGKGTLIMNYTGHGNERQWARQEVLTNNMVLRWGNSDKLPLFITATCDYGRFDNPSIKSGGELLVTTRAGGAIGMITSARPVYSNTNYLLNVAFYASVFDKEASGHKKMGTVFLETKNNSLNGSVNRNFSYLGDPSLTLAYPKEEILIQTINNRNETDTVSAFDKVLLTGQVVDTEGNKLSHYNGVLEATVWDKPFTVETLGTSSPPMTFSLQDNIIFRGQVSVINGGFNIEFIIPKNIDYKKGFGKVSLYSYSENLNLDAGGAFTSIVIGGNENPDFKDHSGPLINLYLNNAQFKSGDFVKPDPVLLAELSDENGINLTRLGIGQEITATLNNNEKLILNDYYQTELDTYKKGTVTYPLKDLEPGLYNLSLKAWDINNNWSEESVDFVVEEDDKLLIEKLLNYPNPFNDKTNFILEHNREGQDLDIKIEIFSTKGELVRSLEFTTLISDKSISGIEWDGTGNKMAPLKNGIYICKVLVKSQKDGSYNQKISKVVLKK